MPRVHPVLSTAREAKARLLAQEQTVARELAAQWRVSLARVQPLVVRFTDAYAAEMTRLGDRVPLTWLYSNGYYLALRQSVRASLPGFTTHAEHAITHGQAWAVQAGTSDAWNALHASLAPIGHLVSVDSLITRARGDALSHLIGRASTTGKPLHTLLDPLPEDAAASVQKALYTGMMLGKNPRAVARDLLDALDGNLARALTIARTEMLGAYRDATSANYRANSDVLDGWYWQADLSGRTCGLCIAMNGTFHPLDEDMASHPSCRCTQVPKTKSWGDILPGVDVSGIPDTSVQMTTGADWLAKQDAPTQDAVLGKAGGSAYRAGDLDLSDLVGKSDGGYYLKSLKQAGITASDYL